MQKQTPICISVVSIIPYIDFLTHPSLFLPLLFHLHLQYLLLRHFEKIIYIACNVLLPKPIVLQLQLSSTSNFNES